MKNSLLGLTMLISAFLLTSCASPDPNEHVNHANNEEATTTQEAVVFKCPKSNPSKIFINKEPVETSLGFIRVAGLIAGDDLSALLEIGGRGTLVSVGQSLGIYRVARISEEGVILCIKN